MLLRPRCSATILPTGRIAFPPPCAAPAVAATNTAPPCLWIYILTTVSILSIWPPMPRSGLRNCRTASLPAARCNTGPSVCGNGTVCPCSASPRARICASAAGRNMPCARICVANWPSTTAQICLKAGWIWSIAEICPTSVSLKRAAVSSSREVRNSRSICGRAPFTPMRGRTGYIAASATFPAASTCLRCTDGGSGLHFWAA